MDYLMEYVAPCLACNGLGDKCQGCGAPQFGAEICMQCDAAFTPTEDGQCLCATCLGEEWGDTAPPSPGYDYDAMAEWQQEKQYRPVHDDTNA